MSKAPVLMSLALAATVLLGCAGNTQKQVAAPKAGPSFSAAERDAIRSYYGTASLAPSATSTLKAGDRLVSGSRPQKLPSDLHSRLKALPEPLTWYVLGPDVLLVNRDSHEILDIIPQAAR